MSNVTVFGQGSFIPSKEPSMKGRVTVVSSALNPASGQVEEVSVDHRYVEFDQMTPSELSSVHAILYGAELTGFYDEHRARLKEWTGKNGFDFVTEKPM